MPEQSPLLDAAAYDRNLESMMLGDRQAAGRIFEHSMAMRDPSGAILSFHAASGPLAVSGAGSSDYRAWVDEYLVRPPGSLFARANEVDEVAVELIAQRALSRWIEGGKTFVDIPIRAPGGELYEPLDQDGAVAATAKGAREKESVSPVVVVIVGVGAVYLGYRWLKRKKKR